MGFDSNLKNVKKTFSSWEDRALNGIGIYIRSNAKSRAPILTGNLKSSIEYKVNGKESVTLGTNVEYAIYVEKGTGKMKSQPFLTPAVERHMSGIRTIIDNTKFEEVK